MGRCKSVIARASINTSKKVNTLKDIIHEQLFFVGDDVELRVSYVGKRQAKELTNSKFKLWKKIEITSKNKEISSVSIKNKKEFECFVSKTSKILIVVEAKNKTEAINKIKREHVKTNLFFVSILSLILALSAYL